MKKAVSRAAGLAVGVVLATAAGGLDPQVTALLQRVQNDLFDVGADLCTPLSPTPGRGSWPWRARR